MTLSGEAMVEQPIGPPVDTGEAQRPGGLTIEGRFSRVEALDPVVHGDGLWQSFRGEKSLWSYYPFGPFADERGFAEWLDKRTGFSDRPSYAVIDVANDRTTGIVTLMEIRPTMRVIEIGGIVYSRALQRTEAATEAQYLMARYVFEDLGYRRYEWKCDALNAASRRAALRLGFTFEGVFRQHRIVNGRNRDSAWYSMLDGEWSTRKSAFERWLAPDNFDKNGRQLVSLSSLNAVA